MPPIAAGITGITGITDANTTFPATSHAPSIPGRVLPSPLTRLVGREEECAAGVQGLGMTAMGLVNVRSLSSSSC